MTQCADEQQAASVWPSTAGWSLDTIEDAVAYVCLQFHRTVQFLSSLSSIPFQSTLTIWPAGLPSKPGPTSAPSCSNFGRTQRPDV